MAAGRATAPELEGMTAVLRPLLPPAFRAVLFGSRARGSARSGADWDIGLVGPGPVPLAVVESVRAALDDLPTLHSFDVVDLATVPEEFRRAALRGAVELT
jgi:predicted nucleotidyltransferase